MVLKPLFSLKHATAEQLDLTPVSIGGGTEIVVGENAFLRMVNVQNWDRGVWHVARQKAVVHKNGKLQWTLAALGSRLSQVAQDVSLVGRQR